MQTHIKALIDHFGGQKEAAEAIKITQATLSHSLKQGYLSADAALRAQQVTNGKFNALDLRPSLKAHIKTISVA